MTTTQLIGLCLLLVSMFVPLTMIARARRALDGDTLLLIERTALSPSVAIAPVLLLGAVLFGLIQMARQDHRAWIIAATPLLLVLCTVLTTQRGYRRMRDGGVPQAFLATWQRAQGASLALFVAGCVPIFWPYVRPLLSAR